MVRGVSINPVAFVVMNQDSIKVMPIEHTSAIDKLMDYVPDLMQRANNIVNKTLEVKKEVKNQNNEQLDEDYDNKEKIKKDEQNIQQKRVISKNIVKTKNKRKEPKIEEIEITYDEDSDEDLEDE